MGAADYSAHVDAGRICGGCCAFMEVQHRERARRRGALSNLLLHIAHQDFVLAHDDVYDLQQQVSLTLPYHLV